MRKFILGCTTLALWLLSPTLASALTVEFVPSSSIVQVGTNLRLDVVLREFAPGITPVVGDFDIFVKFNPVLFASTIEALPTPVVFGSSLGVPGQETTAAWGVYEDTAVDIVRIAEFSGLSASSLGVLQTDYTFILGSLFFDAITQGVSEVVLVSASLGGAPIFSSNGSYQSIGARLPIVLGGPAVITVTAVPEPSTFLLLGAGLFGLIMLRIKLGTSKA